MINETLKQRINEYEQYVIKKGMDETVANAYTQAVAAAFNGDADVKTAFRIANHVKNLINKFIKAKTGGTIWDLEEYLFENQVNFVMVDYFYEI